jgi:hypothetical protein
VAVGDDARGEGPGAEYTPEEQRRLWLQALGDIVALTQEWEATESSVEPAIRDFYEFVVMYTDKLVFTEPTTRAVPVIAKFMYLVARWGSEHVRDDTAFALHLSVASDVGSRFLSREDRRA